jgi:hypothetical protein
MNHGAVRPVSRWTTILSWVFLTIWVSSMGLWYQYAGTRPHVPRPETGNIYVLNTHGSYAYLTFGDCVRLYGMMAIGWGGGAVIIAAHLRSRGRV